jgi:hypothetical protein
MQAHLTVSASRAAAYFDTKCAFRWTRQIDTASDRALGPKVSGEAYSSSCRVRQLRHKSVRVARFRLWSVRGCL